MKKKIIHDWNNDKHRFIFILVKSNKKDLVRIYNFSLINLK